MFQERCCSSMPTMRDGRCYDGTMRVTFALRRRSRMLGTMWEVVGISAPKLGLQYKHPFYGDPVCSRIVGCMISWGNFGVYPAKAARDRRPGASETLTPEDIEVDWLGGYWKLPNADMLLDWNSIFLDHIFISFLILLTQQSKDSISHCEFCGVATWRFPEIGVPLKHPFFISDFPWN